MIAPDPASRDTRQSLGGRGPPPPTEMVSPGALPPLDHDGGSASPLIFLAGSRRQGGSVLERDTLRPIR
jgi:hypothetical protein